MAAAVSADSCAKAITLGALHQIYVWIVEARNDEQKDREPEPVPTLHDLASAIEATTNDRLKAQIREMLPAFQAVEEACTSAYTEFEARNEAFVASHSTLIGRLKSDTGTEQPEGGTLVHHMPDGSHIETRVTSAARVTLYLAIRTIHHPIAHLKLLRGMTMDHLDRVAPPARVKECAIVLHDAICTLREWKSI